MKWYEVVIAMTVIFALSTIESTWIQLLIVVAVYAFAIDNANKEAEKRSREMFGDSYDKEI